VATLVTSWVATGLSGYHRPTETATWAQMRLPLCCYKLQKPRLILADQQVCHLTRIHVGLDAPYESLPT